MCCDITVQLCDITKKAVTLAVNIRVANDITEQSVTTESNCDITEQRSDIIEQIMTSQSGSDIRDQLCDIRE